MTADVTLSLPIPASVVERAASGDVDALATIVRTHHDDMARVAYLITRDIELARDAGEPFRVEMIFGGADAPRTLMKMKLADYVAMQEGRLNGQEAFMMGKMKVEGDVGFLMQIATLTA